MAATVSIVLPVYNQGDHIAALVEGYAEALVKIPLAREFVLVVNACRDNSAVVCHAVAARRPEVRVLESPIGGWGRAVRMGLAEATGDILVYTNSARTPPEVLLEVVEKAVANPEWAYRAHRLSRETLLRRVGSLMYNTFCRVLFEVPGWDINATPKAFSRAVYEQLHLSEEGDLIDLEFHVKCKDLGISLLEVPIYTDARAGGRSTTNWNTALNLFKGAWQASRTYGRTGQWPQATGL